MKFNIILLLAGLGLFSQMADAKEVTVTARAGERQTFEGFGFGLNGPDLVTYPSAKNRPIVQKMLFDDLNTKLLRLWYRTSSNATAPDRFVEEYVASGVIEIARERGVDKIVLAPTRMLNGPIESRCDELGEFIQMLQNEYGITIDITGLQNEPRGDWTADKLADGINWIHSGLESRNLDTKLIMPESSNADEYWSSRVDAVRKEYQDAWDKIIGVASHSYNMCANNTWAAFQEGGKEYWQTESGGYDGPRAAARFLNDMNHRVNYWMWYIGTHRFDGNGNENDHRLIILKSDGTFQVNPKYYYVKQVLHAFDVGAIFRYCKSTRYGDMTYSYGQKPGINVAVGKNPDGSWAIGLVNITGYTSTGDGDKFYAASDFDVTVTIEELTNKDDIEFDVFRTREGLSDTIKHIGVKTMQNGEIVISGVKPQDLITLRSAPLTHVNEPVITPGSFQLQQNYPNPFNPATTIRYRLPGTSHVRLQIFDINGRLVDTLVNSEQPAGSYVIPFSGDGLPSGAYFYKLTAENFSQVRRMVLLR